jgi:hypothetical protein
MVFTVKSAREQRQWSKEILTLESLLDFQRHAGCPVSLSGTTLTIYDDEPEDTTG